MKKKIFIIFIVILIILILLLWFSGIIPKQIAKVYAVNYVEKHFPKMELKLHHIEWSRFHDEYIVSFNDSKGKSFSCVVGPKFFPISMGQGITSIADEYYNNYK